MVKNRSTTLDIAYIAICAALTLVLKFAGDFIPFLKMPQGGSIEIELIILFFASFVLGYKKGIICGLVFWILSFILGQASWFVTIPQYLLDYIIPYILIGLSSLFCFKSIKNKTLSIDIAVFIAMCLKYLSNVLSGVFFYFPDGQSAGSIGAWIYSLSYNFAYNFVTMIICLIVVPIVIERLGKRLGK